MGLRDRLEANAARFGDSARRAAASAPGQLAGESFRGLRSMFRDGDEQALSVERFLILLAGAVRSDEAEERRSRDVYVAARKRRRRLAMLSFGAGPLVGVANQLADLYCETAVLCDLADLHGMALSDEQVGANMLVLWGVTDSPELAIKAMAGTPPVASILAQTLREKAGEQLPERLTKRSVTKALWDVRGALGDARKGSTTSAIGAVAFTGHRTKKVIKRAEAQLADGATIHLSEEAR